MVILFVKIIRWFFDYLGIYIWKAKKITSISKTLILSAEKSNGPAANGGGTKCDWVEIQADNRIIEMSMLMKLDILKAKVLD